MGKRVRMRGEVWKAVYWRVVRWGRSGGRAGRSWRGIFGGLGVVVVGVDGEGGEGRGGLVLYGWKEREGGVGL